MTDPQPPRAERQCELCGGGEFVTHLPKVADYITDETFAIRRCVRCGLGVTDPLPAEEAIDRYYPSRYRTERQKFTRAARVKIRAAAIADHLAPDSGRRLLDIGCGSGAFALEMQRRGWTVAVTELDDAVLQTMRAHGMEAKRPADAMRDGFGEPFDVITCWHVLEHVEHPLALAEWALRNLKPGGIFQVTVPNLMSWQARLFGRHWQHLDVPRHRYHFSPGTLALMLIRSGFEIVHSTSFALEYDLFGVVQSALNPLCTRPNVLFEKLTASGGMEARLPRRDVLISLALAPLVGLAAVPFCLASIPAGRGATLTVTCRPGADARAGSRFSSSS